jgi:perosamine synthetase
MSDEFIPVAEPDLTEDDVEAVRKTVESGWVSSAGSQIDAFEERIAELCGRDHAVAVHNGTVAIHLALEALDVGPGDEVLVPDLTFGATAEAVAHAGGEPILVDVTEETWTMDPEAAEAVVTDDTRAMIPVDLYGHPAHMAPLLDLAEDHDLAVIEDAAEAQGARYKGEPVGSFGDVSTFSFYGNKIITTGEGGICVTDDADVAHRMGRLADHAQPEDRRYWHTEIGWNYRMTNMQAALGVSQLDRFEELVGRRRDIGQLYREVLKGIPGVTLAPEAEWADTAYWLYSLMVPGKRNEIQRQLEDQGIGTRKFFDPLHEMPPFRSKRRFPVATDVSCRGLSLPTSTTMSDETVRRVAEELALILRG